MSFTKTQLARIEKLYGQPERQTVTQNMTSDELAIVRSSMKGGRAHDITLYIKKDGGYIFIAKPFYPPGLFRAPSGGVLPNEDFEAGALREAREETGVEIELEKYFLCMNVRFQSGNDHIDWMTHVFTARYVSGEIHPKDHHEIREARLIYEDQIPGIIDLMLKSGSGGLSYRAYLTREMSHKLSKE